MEKTYKMVVTALFAALTCVSTVLIRIPTPTMGYIHPGDGFVLLCGLLLGPVWGGFAAGLGSALSDFIAGYVVYIPATFVVKALTAAVASLVFETIVKNYGEKSIRPQLVISGIAGEILMIAGYFIFEIFILAADFTAPGLRAAVVASAAGIPANLVQALFGVVISTLLYPALNRIN